MPEEQKRKFSPVAYVKGWGRKDWLALAFLVAVVAIFAIPVYLPKNGCEVARPAYECLPARTVMAEHCDYWGNFSCDSSADDSLPQVEWYIGNLCKIHNRLHPSESIDCTNLKRACNLASGKQVCPLA